MKTKYLDIHTKWYCKKAGGLLLGIRLHFPTLIFVNDYSGYMCSTLTFGLIVCSINLDIKYNYTTLHQ
jgi:hypothetical protein